MLISYLQKTSLVDYPGKVSAIVFTAGCNFRCPFCHNPESVLPERIQTEQGNYPSEQEILTWLESRRGLLDGVSICGWEPTLQSDLFLFIQKIKAMGFLVKLDTNGRDADVLERLLAEKLVDYIAIDAKYPLDRLSTLAGVPISEWFREQYLRCLDLLRGADIDYEYRTTVIKGYHTAVDIREIAQMLSGIPNYYLQNYQSSKTLDPEFDGRSFTHDELLEFQCIASEWVGKCELRG